MILRWLMSLILGCLMLSLQAKAQTFEDGYQSYVRNQFPVAELQFKSALKKVNTDEEKGFILKFIGICQYMRGDKKNSQLSFQQSVTFDRNVQIDNEEVLDPSVIAFFNSIKSRVSAEQARKPKPRAEAPVKKSKPKPEAVATNSSKASAPEPEMDSFVEPKPKTKTKAKSRDRSEDSLLPGRKSGDDRSKLSYTQFLPFGFPQFHHNNYWLGGGVAALQLVTLYSMLDTSKTIKDRQAIDAVVATKDGLTEDQRQTFYSDNAAYISKLKQQKNMALLGFGALWAASIVESVFFAGPTGSKNSSKATSYDRQAPAQSLTPTFQARDEGPAYGVSWQTEVK